MPVNNVIITRATVEDAAEILKLQKLAFFSEAKRYDDFSIPPLMETTENICQAFNCNIVLKATVDGVIIGSVRGQLTDDSCYIGRLIVHPDFQKRGIGSRLMKAIEAEFPQVNKYTLGAGHLSEETIRLYQKLGFVIYNSEKVNDKVTIIHMEKSLVNKE
jgi:ribosomal protein S18 acetylase RimI-like enzyme